MKSNITIFFLLLFRWQKYDIVRFWFNFSPFISWFLFLSIVIKSINGAQVTCRSDPTTDDEDQAVDDGDSFQITCNLGNSGNQQDSIDSCRFEHWEPLNDQRGGNNAAADVECTYALTSGPSNCPVDSRITGTVNAQSCSVTVSNSKPEDTGTWTAFVSTVCIVTFSY